MDIGTEPQTSIASTTTTSAQCNAMQLCTVIYGTRPPTILGLCLDEGKMRKKVTLVIVAHCSTFRLFVVNIVLP